MTKEELEKEVEDKGVEYADKQERTISVHEDSGYSWGQVEQAYEKGALDFAEPREKRISELEKEIIEIEKVSDARWEENQQLKQENEELKTQIEKMHNCENCKHFVFNGFHQQNECSKYSCKWELTE